MSSRYFNFPDATSGAHSWMNAGNRSLWSEMMNPLIIARCTSSGRRFGPPGFDVALYSEIKPQRGNPRAAIEHPQHGGQDGAADVLEVDIDACGTRRGERRREVVRLVADAGVVAQFVDHVAALVRRSGDADRAAAARLRELPHDRTDGPGRGRHDNSFARLRLSDVEQPHVRRHPRHPQHANRRRHRHLRGVDRAQVFSVGHAVLLPAVVPTRQRRRRGSRDFATRRPG